MAASGSSNAPGTSMTVIASRRTPVASSSSSAASSSLFVISPLKRAATIATPRRVPSGSPSRTLTSSGRSSSPSACCSASAVRSWGSGSSSSSSCSSSLASSSGSVSSTSASTGASASSSSASGSSCSGSPSRSSSSPGQRSLIVDLVAEILVMQPVPELVPLGREVARVLGSWVRLDRNLLGDLQAEAFDAGDLLRIVRQQTNGRQPQHREDLVADAVVAHVRLEAELEVRLDRIEAVLLQLVGTQLVEQTDPTPLLCHVQEYTAFLGRDAPHRLVELLTAIATERVEDVARETLGVHADEHVLLAVDIAPHERQVPLGGQPFAEGDRGELAVRRR